MVRCTVLIPKCPIMSPIFTVVLYIFLVLSQAAAVSASAASAEAATAATPFSSQWVVHVTDGRRAANALADDYDFVNLGEIFEDYYHFNHRKIAKRSVDPHLEHRVLLAADTRVRWAQQQRVKRRVKRDFKLQDSDPKWPSMWYLNRGDGLDMNVIPAWLEGVTGKGAVVTILDDGLEKDHPDLLQNYDPLASYDVNNGDSDPSPRYDMIDSNRHGTRCAGEVAATSNNSVCALGVAHGAHVGGVRMLDGDVTDAVEARSLSLNPQHIDIYSASWGPDDDGKTVDGPGELATRAFIEGVTKGRNGKGSIFVWASGNGGRDHDNCNCDGYTNSIYSLSISSATEHGQVPWYSEACSSTLASTYSSGAVGEKQVVTTDLHHSCTSSHTGTSASAPLAAGICALALEANPQLTWRDMQHIVIRTARPQRLIASDWATNGVGRNVSHSFGYGLMDAHAMVQLARKWVSVPEQHRCEIPAAQAAKPIPAKSMVILQLQVIDCPGVEVLEHVQAKVSIQSSRRGDLKIQLTSPMGTKVTLLDHRLQDASRSGFNHWPFMSVHSWGESPYGTWRLEIHNDGRLFAKINAWDLVLYGTTEPLATDLKDPKIEQQPNTFTKAEDFQTNTIEEDSDTLKSLDIMVRKDDNEMPRPTEASARLPTEAKEAEEAAEGIVGISSNLASASTSGCRRTSPLNNRCLECATKYYLRNGICQRCAMPGYFQRADADIESGLSSYTCYPCHYSCAECRGPNDYDCTACYPDATRAYGSYCYPTALMEDLTAETWYYRLCVLIALIASLVIVLAVIHLHHSCCQTLSCGRSGGHEFTKLNLQNIRDIEQSVKNTVYSDDSD